MTPTDIILWLVVVWLVAMLALSVAGVAAWITLETAARVVTLTRELRGKS